MTENNRNDDENLEELIDDNVEESLQDNPFASEDRSTAKHAGKSTTADIFRRIVLVIAVAVFLYSAFMLIRIFLDYKKGDDIYNEIQQEVLVETPTTIEIGDEPAVEVPFQYDHASLLSINSEGVGFLYIPSINLQLPIAQTTDNDFYLTHTFDKTENKSGCLFVDYRITDGLNSSNVIIYGHDMKNGSMFGMLNRYQTYDFWNTEGNDVFYIYSEDRIAKYQIFSVYISDPVSDTYTFNFSSASSLQSYAASMKAQSLYTTGVDISTASQVVTLSTCTSDGSQRLIVQGVYIGDTSEVN